MHVCWPEQLVAAQSFEIHTRICEDAETNQELGQMLFVYVMPENRATNQALSNRPRKKKAKKCADAGAKPSSRRRWMVWAAACMGSPEMT